MQQLDNQMFREITRRLRDEFHPEQIWLFGSHAWGTPDAQSDIDLLVVVTESHDKPVRRAQKAHRCLRGIGVAKDVIVKTRAEFDHFKTVPSSLENQVQKRGRLLYGRSQT